mmetsp:Transcript_10329/g.19005  ORF Transcript_10329/g.19005 Transcript_10329/m.19005 type:complete len:114 (-) Transcript_10329:1639-1980(-)
MMASGEASTAAASAEEGDGRLFHPRKSEVDEDDRGEEQSQQQRQQRQLQNTKGHRKRDCCYCGEGQPRNNKTTTKARRYKQPTKSDMGSPQNPNANIHFSITPIKPNRNLLHR